MATVRRRPSEKQGGRDAWQTRWVDPEGKERARTFARKVDAERFSREVEVEMDRGSYIDVAAARVSFGDYASKWAADQVQHRPTTVAWIDSHLRNHVLPHFGNRPIGQVGRSEVQA